MPTPAHTTAKRRIRNAFGRRMAARDIARLVKAHPGLVAFPITNVGVVEGVTPKLKRPAVILHLPIASPTARAA